MEELMKGTGYIFNSKLESSRSNTMSMKLTNPYYKKYNTPGPGSYQTFSEFGIYKSKNADEIERNLIYGGKSASSFNKTKSDLGKSNVEESKNNVNESNANVNNESNKPQNESNASNKPQNEIKEETKNPEQGDQFGSEI